MKQNKHLLAYDLALLLQPVVTVRECQHKREASYCMLPNGMNRVSK
jgi:hypothetical protein